MEVFVFESIVKRLFAFIRKRKEMLINKDEFYFLRKRLNIDMEVQAPLLQMIDVGLSLNGLRRKKNALLSSIKEVVRKRQYFGN